MSDSEPPKPTTPEEISRKLEDFIKNSLGGQVLFTRLDGREPHAMEPAGTDDGEPVEANEEPDLSHILDFRMRPADIKARLDRYVIRQDEAKKVLATAVCDHYHHAAMLKKAREAGEKLEFSKQNVIILGPTGVGKTYLVKHIAELIGVPFVKADATKFSETGYVGGDVDDLVRDLVTKADGNIELAEHGIIYLDEVDKLATPAGRIGRDVSGRGVQTALLKLMEETDVPLYAPHDMRSQMQLMLNLRGSDQPRRQVINTRNILFIVSGAFSGLDKIVEKRVSQSTIGFGAAAAGSPADGSLLRQAKTQDLISYGFEAEFVGRLPVRVVCDALDADDLFEIMKRSAGSLVRQLEREFEAYGISARFEDSALRIIAARAAEEKTGARGLVTAWESVLRDFKFEMPSLGLPVLEINADLVEDPVAVLKHCREEASAFATDPRAQDALQYAMAFQRDHGLDLRFQPDAVRALVERAGQEGRAVTELCERLFKDFPFGLQLVVKNTGEKSFVLDRAAIADPDRFLSDLVASSYREAKTDA